MTIAAIHHPVHTVDQPSIENGTPTLIAIRGGQDTEIRNLANEIGRKVAEGLKQINIVPILLNGKYINPFAFTENTASTVKGIVSHQ